MRLRNTVSLLAFAFIACVSDDDPAPAGLGIDAGGIDASTSPDATTPEAGAPDVDAPETRADAPAPAQDWAITHVSVGLGGADPDGPIKEVVLSADGRFVAFSTNASNLVAGDNNDDVDVFVYDRQAAIGTHERVSLSTAGSEGNGPSEVRGISADGRFVVFSSSSTDLVAGDGNGDPDVFVRDRQTNTTTRVSVSSAGVECTGGDSGSLRADISADGRYVTFSTNCNGLVPGDVSSNFDVFVHDRQTSTTSRVSLLADGGAPPVSATAKTPTISANARYVVFQGSDDYAANDTNGQSDLFVRHLDGGVTELVSIATAGTQSDQQIFDGRVSSDGRFVVMRSQATNLFPGDDTTHDLLLRDRTALTTINVSVGPTGVKANGNALGFAMTPTASSMAFIVCANLTSEPAGTGCQIYVRDLLGQQVTRISAPPGVAPDKAVGLFVGLSADGRVAAFTSAATNIVTPPLTGTPQRLFIAAAP